MIINEKNILFICVIIKYFLITIGFVAGYLALSRPKKKKDILFIIAVGICFFVSIYFTAWYYYFTWPIKIFLLAVSINLLIYIVIKITNLKKLKVIMAFNFLQVSILYMKISFSIILWMDGAQVMEYLLDLAKFTLLEIISFCLIYMVFSKSKRIKILLNVSLGIFSIFILSALLKPIYYHSLDSGMIITENSNQEDKVDFLGKEFESNLEYDVNVVGNEGYYEVEGLEEGIYAIDTPWEAGGTYSNIKITYPNDDFDWLTDIGHGIFVYKEGVKVEVRKPSGNNSNITYCFDKITNIEVQDYSDKSEYELSKLSTDDMLITISDSEVKVYEENGDYIYNLNYKREEGGVYEKIEDHSCDYKDWCTKNLYQGQGVIELLEQTYVIDYAL